MCTEAQSRMFDWNIGLEFSAYSNFHSKKNPQKCCIFIYITYNYDVHDIKIDPQYLKNTP